MRSSVADPRALNLYLADVPTTGVHPTGIWVHDANRGRLVSDRPNTTWIRRKGHAMKVLVIGATGTIGSAVADALAVRHEVVRASRRGPVRVDMGDTTTIDALFAEVGEVDAVVCCAASGGLTPLDALADTEFWSGLDGKLVGQVNLVRRARFAEPVPGSSLGYLVNAGLEAFVHAAATEMPRGVRLNTVSPGWVRETLLGLGMDPADGAPVTDVAQVYLDAVEGTAHGRTLSTSMP
ncbi:NAD-dependent epimerase/dehydratase family protein [Nocardia testacea]|uniref:NAD-dependent epimerase/dehydratase family protein n=1 Tax=Nocardia testacea TaxID=248551 RepID=UPI0033CD4E14